MRALAHPLRLALLTMLSREGPLTATEAADLLDESPANCSFHLRTLAKYGFVEEVPDVGGRARPWRRVALSQSFSEVQDDPAASMAASMLAGLANQSTIRRLQEYLDSNEEFPREWREAAFTDDVLVYVTSEELAEVGEQILEILMRYRERTADLTARPADARPVQLAAFGTPLPPTPSGY
jgi:predicted ArsR family transcriptional regulator